MGKVWLDALTPKQALLATSMAKVLLSKGYDILLTVRDYDYTVRVAEKHGFKPIIVGGYGGSRLVGKLIADLERAKNLVSIIERESPSVLIAYPSPSASRVAFGLKIPYIALTDSPHSVPASRLSLSLADTVVFSYCIPRESIEAYTYSWTRLVQYNGFDELEWIKTEKPDVKVIENLGLREKEYIVVRLEERYAAYYPRDQAVRVSEIVEKLAGKTTIVALPRYGDQWEELKETKNVIVLSDPVHGVSLEYYAAAVVSGGGTMTREAALLGVPGINLFPRRLVVDECVMKLGFPLYKARSVNEALKVLHDILRDPDRYRVNTRSLIDSLEKPSDVLVEVLENYPS